VARTLSIVKPDGVKRGLVGEVIRRFENEGLRVVALKRVTLQKKEAEAFYAVHKEKGFFQSLTDFMSSGPIVAMVLEGEDAIQKTRRIMGATNPVNAAEGVVGYRDEGSLFRDLFKFILIHLVLQLQPVDERIDKIHPLKVTDLIIQPVQLVDTQYHHQHPGGTSSAYALVEAGGLDEFIGFDQCQSRSF